MSALAYWTRQEDVSTVLTSLPTRPDANPNVALAKTLLKAFIGTWLFACGQPVGRTDVMH